MKEYIKYVVAIVCTLILGVSLYSVQVSKQDSIERQQQSELDYKKEIEYKKEQAEIVRKINLDTCLEGATTAYWDYMELNGTKNDDGSITASNYVWGQAQDRKDKLDDLCFKTHN